MHELTHIDDARQISSALLNSAPIKSLKLRSTLWTEVPDGVLRHIRVDEQSRPGALMLRVEDSVSFFALDLDRGRALLKACDDLWQTPTGFAGVREDLIPLLAAQADIAWSAPCKQFQLPREVSDSHLRGPHEALSAPTERDIDLLLARSIKAISALAASWAMLTMSG